MAYTRNFDKDIKNVNLEEIARVVADKTVSNSNIPAEDKYYAKRDLEPLLVKRMKTIFSYNEKFAKDLIRANKKSASCEKFFMWMEHWGQAYLLNHRKFIDETNSFNPLTNP